MPDPIKDEETENRTNSLCLFGFPNITQLNRCDNCPGAARAALSHRRCPRDVSRPNIFHAIEPESSNISTKSESASSSKGKGKLRDEVDTLLSHQTAALSIGDESTAIQNTEHSDNGKRKANLEPDGQAKNKKKLVSMEYNELSIQEYLRNKPQKPFRDLDSENRYVPGSRRVSPDFCASCPGSFVPGYIMDTDMEGGGVSACKDGIRDMDWQWNSEI